MSDLCRCNFFGVCRGDICVKLIPVAAVLLAFAEEVSV